MARKKSKQTIGMEAPIRISDKLKSTQGTDCLLRMGAFQ